MGVVFGSVGVVLEAQSKTAMHCLDLSLAPHPSTGADPGVGSWDSLCAFLVTNLALSTLDPLLANFLSLPLQQKY